MISATLDQGSVQRTVRELDRYSKHTQDRIVKAIGETGFAIQRDAKIGAPVRYGVLWSSIYVDWKRGVSKQVRYDSQATVTPTFPKPESLQNGTDVIIGSIVEYAQRMEDYHPSKSRFLENAVDFHFPRLERAVSIILEKEAR